jgi:hypothetical protein
VAAANLLVRPLREGTLSTRHLARVQLRRLLPTVVVQWGQRTIQDRFLFPLLAGRVPAKGPLVLRALRRYPVLQGVPARLVGIGVLPNTSAPPAADAALGAGPGLLVAEGADRLVPAHLGAAGQVPPLGDLVQLLAELGDERRCACDWRPPRPACQQSARPREAKPRRQTFRPGRPPGAVPDGRTP